MKREELQADGDRDLSERLLKEQDVRNAIEKIERALHEAGATLRDVVRTRMYVSDLDQWEKVAEAHRRFFGEIRPCTTMVEVGRLFADAIVEIEVDAIVADSLFGATAIFGALTLYYAFRNTGEDSRGEVRTDSVARVPIIAPDVGTERLGLSAAMRF